MYVTQLHFFAITDEGLWPLPIPPNARSFADLYSGLPLGVYSALRTFEHNKFLDLEEHLARTRRSMELLGWDYVWDEVRLRQAIHNAATAFPAENARVRFDILAAAAQKLASDSCELLALMPFKPIPTNYYEEGVGVQITQQLSRQRPLAKTADFAEQRKIFHLGVEKDAYERLIVNADGDILEGTMTNFWAVRDGVVWTARAGVLEGVTRKIILSLLTQLDIPFRLEAYPLAEIGRLDEAAISGSSRALLPVVEIEGIVVGNGRPGPICRQILNAYNEFIGRAVKTAV